MSLGQYVQIVGRGPGRSRSLSMQEAQAAMALMLSGRAAPEATGALLMLLRMKGETAGEIAGFAAAAVESLPVMPQPDLDWPSYAAGRTRGLPWFLLSARLVAAAGYRVMLHGWNGAGSDAMRAAIGQAGIPVCLTAQDAKAMLDRGGIAYVPLAAISKPLFDLLALRDKLGLRSCINTVVRMQNPAGARASVQGVFHPSYRPLQVEAAELLGWHALTVIKGGGGEFECHPAKDIAAFGLRGHAPMQIAVPASRAEARRLDDGATDPGRLAALWSGALDDCFAEAIVLGTATLALDTLCHPEPAAAASDLWARRHSLNAA